MKIFKKGMAIILVAVMLLTVMPITAFAEKQVAFELVLDQTAAVTMIEDNDTYLSFTPDDSGYYKFSSSNGYCDGIGDLDPIAWLTDSEDNSLAYNDDSNGTWEFELTCSLEAGKVYYLQIGARGKAGGLDVCVTKIEPKVIQSIAFEDVLVLEGDTSLEEDYNEETGEWTPQYEKYVYSLVYTVTYSDGSSVRRGGNNVYDDMGSYWINVTDGQSYETPWGLGAHTVTVSIEDLNINDTFTVTVKESPVASVEVGEIKYIENYYGDYTYDTVQNPETGEYEDTPEYFRYNVSGPGSENMVITLKDGTVIENNCFEWEGQWYEVTNMQAGQSYENRWTLGNTYEVTAEIAGCEFTYHVEIAEFPIASIEMEKVVCLEGSDGYYKTDGIYDEDGNFIGETPEYFYYSPDFYTPIITLTDGTVIEDTGFYWYDTWYHVGNFRNDQSYENQWTVGNTYEVTYSIADRDFTYEVEIVSSPVASVDVEKITIMEGANGYYKTEELYDEETGDYIGESPEYYYYYVPWPNGDNTTITLTDGTVIEGTDFDWNGQNYWITNAQYGQSYENQWTAGNTYEVSAEIAGYEFTYEVEIVASPVASVEVEKSTIIEGTKGQYITEEYWNEETQQGEVSPEYFCYDTPYPQEYNTTITLTDGTVINDNEFEWNGRYYSIDVYGTNQCYDNQWTAGNTYEIFAEIAGFEFTYEVEIMSSPVASVEVEKITIMEGNDGRYITDYLYDEETGEYIESPEYLYYEGYWPNWQNTTITLKDGTVIEGTEFDWNGQNYWVTDVQSGQCYENQWSAGNTYVVTAKVAGYTFTYEVEVIKSPVASVEVEKITFMEGENGDYRTDEYWNVETQQWEYSPEYFRYYLPWPSNDTTVITLTDGTVIRGNSFEYNGVHFSISVYDPGQCYENQWTAGNTYELTGEIAGFKFTYETEIKESPVASVVVEPVRVVENTRGWYSRDCYWNEETGQEEYSPEYFRYDTPWPENVTITLKDGTVIHGTSFEFDGQYYSMGTWSIDQSYENQLTVGSTYPVQAVIGGYKFTYDMEIVQLNVSDAYEYIATDDGVIITDSFIAPETLEIPAELGGLPVVGVAGLCGFGGTKHLVFPDSVRTIGDYVIADFYSLETITFGAGIDYLESGMFYNSYDLKSITVSEDNSNYTTENGVLYNKNKTSVIAFPVASGNTFNVPDTVTDIKALSASIYGGLEVVFSAQNPNFVTEDGVTYNKDKTKILFCSKNKTGKYVMPDTVIEIADSAFSGCSKLTEVVVSSQVTELVYCVFFSCLSLEKVELPDGLISIEQSAFEGTTALESIELPNGLEKIGGTAFLYSGLTSLTVPNSVKIIGYSAFNATRIETLDLGTGIEEIYGGAFANTPVTAVTLPDSLTYLGDNAFANCHNLKTLNIGSGLFEISESAFRNTGIQNLTIPENIRYISDEAFYCSTIETLTLNDGLEYIGESAFAGCQNLTSVVIPDTVETIDLGAFYKCTSLANVELGDGLKNLGSNAFMYCAITDLDLGNSIEVISPYAFEANDMTEQFFPNSVTTIMYGAFMDCEELTSIELPLSVDTIEFSAFANCSNLTDVYYEGTEEDRNNMNIDPEGNEYLLNATWHYGHVNDKWSGISEDAPAFVVESATGKVGDTVTVAIKTKNNPGITGLKLYVDYDSNALEFLGGTKSDFADGVFSISPVENNPISIVWTSTSLMSEDGTIALLTFRVKDDAPVGKTGIAISYDSDDVFGEDVNEKIEFATKNGFVDVFSYISGDVNEDGNVNNKDLALLLRYVSDWPVEIDELAADVNRDGDVNTVDLGILLRYLSDWDVELK